MGRKIPGKKHRTVKDPYEQNRKRLESLKSKINNPPSNADDQEIPKSLLKIMELKKKAKQKTRKPNTKHVKRKTKTPMLSLEKFFDKEPVPKGMKKPEKFIPNIVQKPNESTKSFLGRVSRMTQNLINEVEFEKKFGVEIKKNPVTGEVTEVKHIKKKKSKSKKKKLMEKRKEKLNQKISNLKNIKDFNQLKDKVEFGEVVHGPPDLTAIKKKKKLNQNHKYGNLLLNSTANSSNTNNTDLPSNFEKEKAENERKFIVEAYRRIKKLKKN